MTRKAPSEQLINDCIGCHGREILVSKKNARSRRPDRRLAHALRKACAACHQSRDTREFVRTTKDHVHPSGNKRGGKLITTISLRKSRIANIVRRGIVPIATLVMAGAARSATEGVTLHCGQNYVALDFYVLSRYLSRSDTSSNDFSGPNNFSSGAAASWHTKMPTSHPMQRGSSSENSILSSAKTWQPAASRSPSIAQGCLPARRSSRGTIPPPKSGAICTTPCPTAVS